MSQLILGYQGLQFQGFLSFFFSIRPTDRISGNTLDAKKKKKQGGGGGGGMALAKLKK